jgi:hypothetical protein
MFIQICRPMEKLPTGAVYSAAVSNLHFGFLHFGFLHRIHIEKAILASRPGRHASTPMGRQIFSAAT